jgi:hypothetical protein
VPYPFTGSSIETHLEIYHVAHGNYETRAPIRTMQFATLNGEDTLIAAYACSPIVTILRIHGPIHHGCVLRDGGGPGAKRVSNFPFVRVC